MNGDLTFSERLILGLEKPVAYEHPVTRIERLETHISWVLLTGEVAYKIKKPVDFGFVNFSTLERRKHFCEEELRLNRRLCPEMYLRVVPITGTVDAPRMDGAGEAIEYAVEMREFPQDCLLSRMIRAGGVDAARIDRLVREVAGFHERIVRDVTGIYGTPEDVLSYALRNFDAVRGCEADAQERRLIEELHEWTLEEFESRKDDFDRRRSAGFVRECHGDMHLGNMVADGEGVLIFDCIEFNDHLRWIDVMSEVAFLVMDLKDRGRGDLSNRFLNGWLEATGDYAGLIVLPYYLVYRALVRAKVAALRLQQTGGGDAAAVEERRAYVELAGEYARRTGPRLWITHGVSGSGKTTVSQSLVDETGAVRIRSDVERKRLLGLRAEETTEGGEKAAAYSAEMTEKTYGRVAELAEAALGAGFSVIADATFLQRRYRDLFRDVARRLSVPFQILHYEADVETLRERIVRRSAERTDASEADLRVLEMQLAAQEPLGEDEREFVVPGESGVSPE